jgi:microcephalin
MKAMLAVANGAYIISPEWISASLEAGKWLPESDYRAKVRFAEASERCRRHTSASEAPLLSGYKIFVDPGSKTGATKASALKRVAEALGAVTVREVTSCTLCVMVGDGGCVQRPRGLPRTAPAVTEEWLLQTAETFKVPAIKRFRAS